MGRIIAVSNHKGGVGKTTSAISLSAAFVNYGKRVLLVDMDPQGNCAGGLGLDTTLFPYTLVDALAHTCAIEEAIHKTSFKDLDILPSNVNLAIVETKIHDGEPFKILKNLLDKVLDQYDFILIDTPPSFGFLSISSLVAADEVLIPVQCEYFALEGVAQILGTISNVQQMYNEKLSILGFVMTMYDARLKLSTEVTMEVRGLFKEKTFVTQIPKNNSIVEAQKEGIPVTFYRPTSTGSLAYLSLAREILAYEAENALK